MTKSLNISLSKFLQNATKFELDLSNYLGFVLSAGKIHEDFSFGFLELVSPEFLVLDGHIYLRWKFDREKYDDARSSMDSLAEAQYWLNNIEITDIFENMSEQDALHFARRLVAAWNLKIEAEYPDALGRAHVVHEEEDNEVYVFIKTEEM